MKKTRNALKSNQGAALTIVLIAFVVIVILVSSGLYLMSTNLKQAKQQEKMIQAYYLANSGIEIGYSALVNNNDELLNKFKEHKTVKEEEKGIDFGEGKIDVVITSYEEKGTLWIKISSTGTLNIDGISSSMAMSFPSDNKESRKWEK